MNIQPLFSTTLSEDGNDFGSFIYEFVAQVSCSPSDLMLPDEIKEFLDETDDGDLRFDTAMRQVAYFHELRHFHDTFGTLAGCSLFGSHLKVLKEFVSLSFRLQEVKVPWQLPLSAWEDAPDFVHKFTESFTRYKRQLRIFLGRINLQGIQGHFDQAWVGVKVMPSGQVIPAFPYRYLRKLMSKETCVENSKHTYPQIIGYECLLEANAMVIQDLMLGFNWPSEIRDRVSSRLKTQESSVSGEVDEEKLAHLLEQTPNPYLAVDLMISKYLRSRGVETFSSNLVLQLVDAALNRCIAPSIGHDLGGHPGWSLIEQLTSVAEKNEIQQPVLSYPSSQEFQNYLAELRKSPSIEETAANRGWDPIAAVESVITHHCAVPLFEARLEFGNELFSDPAIYFKHFLRLPKPPLTILSQDVGTTKAESPEGWPAKWCEFVFLNSIIEQVCASDAKVIKCPAAYPGIPRFNSLEFCSEGSCATHRNSRSCLVWSPGRRLPKCMFASVLRFLGFQ